jgi:hypothetical protein
MAKIRYDKAPKEVERSPKQPGKDLLEVELVGIDAYTFSQVNHLAGDPHNVPPERAINTQVLRPQATPP